MVCKHPEGHFCLAKSICGCHLSYLLSVTQQHSAYTLREHHAWDSNHGNSLWGVDKCSIRKNVEYQRNTVLKHLTFHSTSFRQTGQWLSKMLKETWETEFRNRCYFFSWNIWHFPRHCECCFESDISIEIEGIFIQVKLQQFAMWTLWRRQNGVHTGSGRRHACMSVVGREIMWV